MGNTKPVGVAFSDPELDGGSIDNTPIGSSVPLTGAFTSVVATSFNQGTPGSPTEITEAGILNGNYATTSATSGDTRLNYQKLTFTGAGGSGETIRAFSVVTVAGAAVGGTINGAHISMEIDGSGTISGAGNALRATLGGTSAAPGGTLAAIQLDSNFSSGGSWGVAYFMRFTNTGSGAIDYLANIPTTGSGLMVAAHTTEVMTDSIRIKMANGVVRYIMLTTASSNRTGGA